MLYEIDKARDKITKISFDDIDSKKLIAGLITIDDLKVHNHIFNFSEFAIMECESGNESFRSSIDVYEDYIFGIINVVNVENLWEERDRIGIFIRENIFLLVDIKDTDKSIQRAFDFGLNRIKPSGLTIERIICNVLESFLYNDNKHLEVIEFEISTFEEEVTSMSVNKQFTAKMLAMKKKLLLLHNYYEQLIDIGEELQENKNDIFNEHNLRYFRLFTGRVTRISQTVQRLRENLVQIREAYQNNLDINLNSIMKIFTVVTMIFSPLTLIVGWYGMNFSMPELAWKYGYIYVVFLSIFSLLFCIWIFKKKNLL